LRRGSQGNGTWQMFADESFPQGIVRAQNGDYWVANGNNSTSLSRFTPKGKMTVFQIGYIPLEITVDQNGNFWLTNQEYENQIIRVTPTLKVTSFSLTDDAYGGITLGGDGNIWFVETDYIGELTPGGKLTEYPTPETTLGGSGLAWSPDGLVWFSDYSSPDRSYVLASLDPKTGVVKSYHASTTSSAVTIVAAHGSLWYLLTGNTVTLVRFDPKTEKAKTYTAPGRLTPSGCPSAMTLSPDGSLWYASQRLAGRGYTKHVVGGGFVRFDIRTQSFTAYASPKGYQWKCDLVVGTRNKVWGTTSGAVTVLSLH